MKNTLNKIKNTKIIDKLRKMDRFTLVIMVSIFTAVLGFIFISIGYATYREKEVSYNTVSNVNYKVYLTEGNSLNIDFMGEDENYIPNIIDNIDIHFDYIVDFEEKLNGKITYYLKAVIEDEMMIDDENYSPKEYVLTDVITRTYHEETQLEINQDTMINYKEYLDILNTLQNEYNFSRESNLKLVLAIENRVLNKEQIEKVNLALNIPLSEDDREVQIETEKVNGEGKLTDIRNYNTMLNKITKALGYMCYAITGISLVYLIVRSKKKKI